MSTTKLPTDNKYVIRDPDLAAAVEQMLKPYTGPRLEKAQAAVRSVRASGVQGTYTEVVTAYRAAIQRAVGSQADD